MKIKCEFCGSMMNDTVEACPNCGAPNPNVRRSSGDQPLTIEQLKQWYESKGLPPYTVTRFFIGENYTEPRAFGIYYEEETGNYIVYKNKASGERAVRYRGTDEAYAVNELFQRLKQEITQQKMNSVKKGTASPASAGASGKKTSGCLGNLAALALLVVGGFAALIAFILVLGTFLSRNDPSGGYYFYDDTSYYYSTRSYGDLNWFYYDDAQDDWQGPLSYSSVPDALETKKQAKEYFVQSDWAQSLPCGDFSDSAYARDLEVGLQVQEGYYTADGLYYYHLPGSYNEGWFVYTGQWEEADFSDLPAELRHSSLAADAFLSENYKSRYGVSDFAETLFYRDHNASQRISRGYYQVEDDILYHLGDYYFDGWYAYDDEDDEWRSVDMDAVPEALHHPSLAEDFYFTPTWDASTQFSDFEDTDAYKDASRQWDNDDDSDYDWGSDDSWDSGDTDWDSDW